jgi:hypothetical protein
VYVKSVDPIVLAWFATLNVVTFLVLTSGVQGGRAAGFQNSHSLGWERWVAGLVDSWA